MTKWKVQIHQGSMFLSAWIVVTAWTLGTTTSSVAAFTGSSHNRFRTRPTARHQQTWPASTSLSSTKWDPLNEGTGTVPSANQERDLSRTENLVLGMTPVTNSASKVDRGDTAISQSADYGDYTSSLLEYTTQAETTASSYESGMRNWGKDHICESRLAYPEYDSGQVPRLFSALEYSRQLSNNNSVNTSTTVQHAAGSVWGAAALVAGTTVGAGVLALPAATAATGFLPSTMAMIMAWVLMTASGLLIAELTLNRLVSTGRPGVGLLELYESQLGPPWSWLGTASYFFLHYAMMVAYIAQGGVNLRQIFESTGMLIPIVEHGWLSNSLFASFTGDSAAQVFFATLCGLTLYIAKPSFMEKVNNGMVVGVFATFLGILAIGATQADWVALVAPANQHAGQVLSCFPILFLALVYQNIVPTVVSQLEGDRTKITNAIVTGTTLPLIMFLAWNAVVLGIVIDSHGPGGIAGGSIDPVSLLKSGASGAQVLGPLVAAFSSLAVITSLIGFTYGLLDAWTDCFKIPSKGPQFDRWRAPLLALIFLPPLALSMSYPDIFFEALEYGGAFGVSTLFLILPPLMVWKERYQDIRKPLVTRPTVPLGKIPLATMWVVSLIIILQEAYEKFQ